MDKVKIAEMLMMRLIRHCAITIYTYNLEFTKNPPIIMPESKLAKFMTLEYRDPRRPFIATVINEVEHSTLSQHEMIVEAMQWPTRAKCDTESMVGYMHHQFAKIRPNIQYLDDLVRLALNVYVILSVRKQEATATINRFS